MDAMSVRISMWTRGKTSVGLSQDSAIKMGGDNKGPALPKAAYKRDGGSYTHKP